MTILLHRGVLCLVCILLFPQLTVLIQCQYGVHNYNNSSGTCNKHHPNYLYILKHCVQTSDIEDLPWEVNVQIIMGQTFWTSTLNRRTPLARTQHEGQLRHLGTQLGIGQDKACEGSTEKFTWNTWVLAVSAKSIPGLSKSLGCVRA